MEKKIIEEYFKLFYHNQNNIYFGSYGTTFDPFETPEGKLKYKSKIGKNPQTRLINKEFSLEDVLTHLLYNKDSFHCDENGTGNHENFVSYGKPVVNKIKVGNHEVIEGHDLGIVDENDTNV